ncbi:hypothetical protein PC116_g11247 [Phytophthora cactorum]|uniref:Uncharacterized protein n=1 Tax=Phytophthora cactorum TaxID=29920 RepID=A0A8T1D5Q2_9STRA|nr:hypothetical protein PC114_g13465 [Phytophthora cactorum]KAG2932686.1 hypothetical protein PC117_g13074 [Phytophthora cactorum]KAG3010924.1 hypothetical protein PC119_g13381 [Phytophthora cactorum]KAG3028251.1 hypothetical protein PC120_g4934 [Phytophthora cactorum]KAG4059605.1 hypothetical protein PC123_g5467 [Phytophthora cactorum]
MIPAALTILVAVLVATTVIFHHITVIWCAGSAG